jgi:transcriptional regulator with XRE-family HTH domain
MLKGLTSKQLADLCGIGQASLSRIENGSREPRFEIVKRLHKQLDLTDNIIHYLNGGNFSDEVAAKNRK